jgi:ABC-2 type transport system permease protein
MSTTTSTPTHGQLGAWGAVRLVASREIITRVRSKAYLITTLILTLLVVAVSVFFAFSSGDDSATKVGVTDESLVSTVESSGDAVGVTIEARVIPDVRAGRVLVSDGTISALLALDDDGTVRATVKKDLDAGLSTAFDLMARQVALNQAIEDIGGDPAAVEAAANQARVVVDPLEQPFDYKTDQLVLGVIAGILIYLSLLVTGQMVAQGVVEEKSSRVVELLLSTVRPWQLMAGKVLGIGVVGLLQMAVIAGVGVTAAIVLGVFTISASAAIGTVIWLLVWFTLGFFMFALIFAAAAALVSRQEEVASVVTPASMLVVAGYVVGISVLPSDPDNKLAEILSMIPTFAPTLMPMRLAMGGVPVWEAVLSVGLVIALIPGLIWLSGRIYRNAVMRTGSRVKLRDALREA